MSKHNSFLFLVAMLVTGAVQADDYHYVNMLVGDRAAGMGGAYTAVADDTAGLFYNPAGIVYAPGSSLSGSMNAYQQNSTNYKKVLGGQYDWKRSSGTLLPNFFGIVQPLGKGMVGFSYAVPNSIEEDQDQIFPNIATTLGTADRFIINFNNSDNTYQFGPSYAYPINDRLSVGATLYFHYRQQQRISNTILAYTSASPVDRVWSNEYYQLEEKGVKPVLGVTWSPMNQLALGASVSKVELFDSNITIHQACLGANSSVYNAGSLCQSGNILNHQVITSTIRGDYPLNINLGGAWFASDALLVSADIKYFGSSGSGEEARISVTNFALGAEYYLNPRWALRGGFYTDFANTPNLQSNFTAYNQPEHVDLYGLAFSFSHFTRNSSLSFGFNYTTGSGKAQIVSGSTTLQDVSVEGLGIFMAASYSY
jgi:long-subunit fatty acid transport protein